MIQSLVDHLQQFPTTPTDPTLFLAPYLSKEKSKKKKHLIALAAFNFFVDLSYEKGRSLIKFLPLLLQNAIVLYGPLRVREKVVMATYSANVYSTLRHWES